MQLFGIGIFVRLAPQSVFFLELDKGSMSTAHRLPVLCWRLGDLALCTGAMGWCPQERVAGSL